MESEDRDTAWRIGEAERIRNTLRGTDRDPGAALDDLDTMIGLWDTLLNTSTDGAPRSARVTAQLERARAWARDEDDARRQIGQRALESLDQYVCVALGRTLQAERDHHVDNLEAAMCKAAKLRRSPLISGLVTLASMREGNLPDDTDDPRDVLSWLIANTNPKRD